MPKKIYCGLKEELPENYDLFGTRFRCLQTGWGLGTQLERKAREKGKTLAIKKPYKKNNIYCGYKGEYSQNYNRTGNRYECMKKGIGAVNI